MRLGKYNDSRHGSDLIHHLTYVTKPYACHRWLTCHSHEFIYSPLYFECFIITITQTHNTVCNQYGGLNFTCTNAFNYSSLVTTQNYTDLFVISQIHANHFSLLEYRKSDIRSAKHFVLY